MFYLEDNLFKEHYLENNGDKLSFKVFPEVSLPMERNLSRERIRQGPVFPRHTAARNMRSTKKSNTFLYRYSTFLHTTLTTIHGTTFHLNDTIKIAHFSFLFFFFYRGFRRGYHLFPSSFHPWSLGEVIYRVYWGKKKSGCRCLSWVMIKNLQFLRSFLETKIVVEIRI